MKTVLDKPSLVDTARSKATGSKVGFAIFCLIFGLFIVVMALVSWIWAIPFAAFVVLIGYCLFLSCKEKSNLAKQLKKGNFRILVEPIVKKSQENINKTRCYYFYLDEKRRVHVDLDVYQKSLEGNLLYTVYVAEATTPLFIYPENTHSIGRSLRGYLVQQEETEETTEE